MQEISYKYRPMNQRNMNPAAQNTGCVSLNKVLTIIQRIQNCQKFTHH